ncbi:MAG: helix-turn-helix domain-containing protein [Leucobacter sp.]
MTTEFIVRIPGVELTERVHALEHLVLWQVRGQTELTCLGAKVTLREGQAAWIPMNTPHSLRVRENSVTAPLFISVIRTPTVLDAFTIVSIAPDDKLYLLSLWNSQSSIIQPNVDLCGQVVGIIERAAHATELSMPRTPEVAAVARALVRNPGDSRQISEWATEACMSGRSLERAFVAETGLSFGQWRKECRMIAARRLLTSGETVQNTARVVGYENPSSFSRAFREYHDVRPRDCTPTLQRA